MDWQTLSNGLRCAQESKIRKDLGITEIFIQTDIYIQTKTSFYFKLIPETWWTRLCKFLSLGLEVQTGDQAFDDTFYVASDTREFHASLKLKPNLREVILELKKRGLKFIQCEGRGLIHIRFINPGRAIEAQTINTELKDFVLETEGCSHERGIDPFAAKLLFLELLLYGVGGYALGFYLNYTFDTFDTHLQEGKLRLLGMTISLMVFFVWLLMGIRWFRASSRLPLVLTEIFLFLFFASIIGGGQILLDINTTFDTSEPRTIQARVIDKYSVTRGSGKNRKTRFYLKLFFEKEVSDQIPNIIEISFLRNYNFTPGQGAEIILRDGLLNYTYIDDLKPIPLPERFRAPLPEVSEKLIQELKHYPENLEKNILNPKATYKEEHYPNGQIRAREPVSNGQRHGVAIYFFDDGRLYGKIPWEKGLKHGCFELLRSDGSKEMSLCYKKGQLHGPSFWYDYRGNITHKGLYQKDVLIKSDF